MSINLVDLIKGQLGPETVSQTATQLGESESGISKAISALLPAVIGGFANNNTQSELFSTVKEASSSGVLSNLLQNLNGTDSVISKILSLIFGDGDKLAAITNSVSSYAGIKNESTNSLLNLVTGATAGTLGKYAVDHNLDVSSFGNLLGEQKGFLSSILPAGFSFASLGLGNWFGTMDAEAINVVPEPLQTPIADVNPVTPITEEPVVTETPKIDVTRSGTTHEIVSHNDSGGSIWKWLLPLLLLLLLGWFFWKQCNKKAEPAPVATTVDSTTIVVDSTNSAGNTVGTTRETLVVTLPSGKTLQAYKGGIEDQIVNFLKSDEYKNATEAQLKEKWFNFDNLNFEFGKAVLTPESQVQLDNLKLILAEFPDAKIRIGAYTDKKGDETVNLKLSGERANVVKSSLNSPQVLEAEGYGSKFAKVPAEATDKERESDRKTAVRFTK
ncbi:OmpA family protein [Epilithonimonas hungarica]|uniref:OmpA family protein n=1 Tax=Epilithonimonas hungarica TaxID=454006 RepID=A0A1G7U671_9FLAO|nr:OmpA family protein [Epilithonimonas hungarica]SDG42924.1 OmpA family protein [Epilithonimonas hungarica]